MDRRPTRWRGEPDLSLRIHTQLRIGKLSAFAIFPFHPIKLVLSPLLHTHTHSLASVFVILPSRSVLPAKAGRRDTGGADGTGQVAVCYSGCRSDGSATLACRCHKSKAPAPKNALGSLPILHRSCQHAKTSINAGPLVASGQIYPISSIHLGRATLLLIPLLFASLSPPLRSLLRWPSADLTGADYYLGVI